MSIPELQKAFAEKRLTLYLGAGVSMGSGLPSWEGLVLAMYFNLLDQQRLGGWRPFPNYLFAITDWQLEHLGEPLEITARKIRLNYQDTPGKFIDSLHETLYQNVRKPADEFGNLAGLVDGQGGEPDVMNEYDLFNAYNPTLEAVAHLCDSDHKGIKSVITYNYDALLEQSLPPDLCQAIWRGDQKPAEGKLPIYHVHGFVPFEKGAGSDVHDIVFTEEQYNRVANDPYSWSNLVQLHSMSSNVGLMVGLSLADRNMRRLFDAVRRAPLNTKQYAILKKEPWKVPSTEELSEINQKAISYINRFAGAGTKGGGGMKKGNSWEYQIAEILKQVQIKAEEQETKVLNELGIEPIWIKDFAEIPMIIDEVLG